MTDRQTDKADRQTARQTNKQTDKTDRQLDTCTLEMFSRSVLSVVMSMTRVGSGSWMRVTLMSSVRVVI